MKAYLLLVTLVFGCLFLFYKPEGQVGFPFDDMVLSSQTYIYFLFEKLIVLILAVVILQGENRMVFKLFVIICALDVVDYVLFYGNAPYWNIIKVATFGTAIIYEKWSKS